jgi:hypothetical protein
MFLKGIVVVWYVAMLDITLGKNVNYKVGLCKTLVNKYKKKKE